MARWYVCQTKPRQEAKAEKNLVDQGYEVYLPRLTRWVRKRNAWQPTEEVMFPRYGFLRCGQEGQSVAPIRSTPGVQGLVRFGTCLATLEHRVVEAIRQLAEQSRNHQEATPNPFTPGMHVMIIDGPLKGLTGLVSEIADQRIAVLLTLIGQEQRLLIPAGQLIPSA